MALFRSKKDTTVAPSANGQQDASSANHDALTNLPTRQGVIDEVERISQDQRYAFVLICMDRFSDIHKIFGLDAGSLAVKNVVETLKSCIEPKEILYRESLNEFGLMLKAGDEESLIARIENLLAQLNEIEITDGTSYYVYPRHFTCGVYVVSRNSSSMDEIVDMAGLALKKCRQQNLSYALYKEDTDNEFSMLKQLYVDIADAMEREEIVPYFQPRYDFTTGRIVGADLLARWEHPDRGVIMPGVFLPLLQQRGTIMELDMYMVEQACKLISKWLEKGSMPVPLAINLSPLNMYKRDFVTRIKEISTQYGTSPQLIELEMDESALYDNSENILSTSASLSDFGFRLCVDNFGSGYTSLNMVTKIPSSQIKLDRMWWQSDRPERNVIVMKNIVQMAQELGMLIIASGIETRHQVEVLKKIHCNQGMGFLFSKPMPQYAFETLTL